MPPATEERTPSGPGPSAGREPRGLNWKFLAVEVPAPRYPQGPVPSCPFVSLRALLVPVSGDSLFTDSPSVILEVLSPTTRRIDEVQKFRDYITVPSLVTYLLAETDSPFLTLHRRDGAGFRRETLTGRDAVLGLPEAGISMPLAELYRDVR